MQHSFLQGSIVLAQRHESDGVKCLCFFNQTKCASHLPVGTVCICTQDLKWHEIYIVSQFQGTFYIPCTVYIALYHLKLYVLNFSEHWKNGDALKHNHSFTATFGIQHHTLDFHFSVINLNSQLISSNSVSPLLFSSSPPFSQNNRDNNYLNLNYEYKGKRGEICSPSKNCFLPAMLILNSNTTEKIKRGSKSLFIIRRQKIFCLFVFFPFRGNYSHTISFTESEGKALFLSLLIISVLWRLLMRRRWYYLMVVSRSVYLKWGMGHWKMFNMLVVFLVSYEVMKGSVIVS